MENKMEFTLTKTRSYNLVPFGKFDIKWKSRSNYVKANVILVDELHIKHDTSFPIPADLDKQIIKLMKQSKTDILTDGECYYTRTGIGQPRLTEVYHAKLARYKTDECFKSAVDDRQ